MDPFDLSSRTALVIGGSGGIGKDLAKGLKDFGANVVISSRTAKENISTYEALGIPENKRVICPVDVTSEKSIAALSKKIISKFKRIDVVVNCAGTHQKKDSFTVSEKEWDKVIDVNLKGTFLVCKVIGEQMKKQGSGKIINIASLGSHVSLTQAAAYCASKGGVLALTKTLACEWAQYNINVNSITPGVFRTELNKKALSEKARLNRILNRTPMRRLGDTKDLIGAALLLASSAGDFITGETICVDGGFLSYGI
jgi:2-dehydro-3-deoxy-D-gluconate 5-dehydrogenase